jgi:hypothetical protein
VNWEVIITAFITAAFTGAVASLALPWSKWGVEKRKLKHNEKRELIKSWHEIANDYSTGNCDDIIDHKNYFSLRAYLSDEAIRLFEVRDRNTVINIDIAKIKSGASGDETLRLLLEEIKRIQKEWKML